MAARRLILGMVLTSLGALTMGASSTATRAQGTNDLAGLQVHVSGLHSERRFAEAIPIAEFYVSQARHRHGEDHKEYATAISWLGILYGAQGRYSEAEPLLKRALAVSENALGLSHPDIAIRLSNLADLYPIQGRGVDAEPLYQRAVAIAENALGPDHPDLGPTLNKLALLYEMQSRNEEAVPLYRRALTIAEKAVGAEHAPLVIRLHHLGSLIERQGRFAEAEPLYQRALAIAEKALGADHPDLGPALNKLALLYESQGRHAEVVPLYERAITIAEKAHGPDLRQVGIALNNLAEFYMRRGRYVDAEVLYRRELAVAENAGLASGRISGALSKLAALHENQGRFAEAELLYKRALTVTEEIFGSNKLHPDIATRLRNLAVLYRIQGRYTEAEPLFKRMVVVLQLMDATSPEVGAALNDLALLYLDQGRYAEAEPLLKRAFSIAEMRLRGRPDSAFALISLASLYERQGRYAEAEPLYQRALAVVEKALGPDHKETGMALSGLAVFYMRRGRYIEAEPLMHRALVITEKWGSENAMTGWSLSAMAWLHMYQGRLAAAELLHRRSLDIYEEMSRDHPGVSGALYGLSVIHFLQHDWTRAADLLRRSTNLIMRRSQRDSDDVGHTLTGEGRSEAEQSSFQFHLLIKVIYRLVSREGTVDARLLREMFQTAQWPQGSEAAKALSQMAARGAKSDQRLATLVRERQDLVAEWRKRDVARSTAIAQPLKRRDRDAEEGDIARLAAIDTRVGQIDETLKDRFPDYAALSRPDPLSVEDVQAQLGADEALVLILDTPEWQPTPEETFIWVVTKTDVHWVRSDFGTLALTREVQALRCGLDGAAWQADGGSRCAKLHGIGLDKAPMGDDPLPFDLTRAHELYRALFGQVAEQIRGKHLLIVPSGPLAQLPFHVLVTEKPDPTLSGPDAFRRAAWLAKHHAITVLPAVSSLKALRQHSKASRATRPMIGFGNPLLDGPQDDLRWAAHFKKQAALAREKQLCPGTRLQYLASHIALGAKALTQRGGLADVAEVRAQVPLPETADELCAVARDLMVADDNIYLGVRASERKVKALSENGELSTYRIVHFATHGVLAGELSPNAEPGLILTPPENATAEDDGYLTASEIAGLKLDADWVILSACNTAAGGVRGAEALSGLARAFFYAQARALLVSHWAVYSGATVKLITRTIGTMVANKSVGRAEALRRSMMVMIEEGDSKEAHPAYWAPFVVVGDGADAT